MSVISQANLAVELGVSEAHVVAWIAEGLPHTDGQMDFATVESWLIKKGYAETPDQVVHTQSELAAVLGVSTVTAAAKMHTTGFPSGPPWSVSALVKWKEDNAGGSRNNSRDELDRIKLETAKLKLQREQGEVIALQDVVEEMTRQNVLAKQKTKKLVPMLLELLPADTDPRIVADFRQRAAAILYDMHDDLANAFRSEATYDSD